MLGIQFVANAGVMKATLAHAVSVPLMMTSPPAQRDRVHLCVQAEVPACAASVNATEESMGGSVNVMIPAVPRSEDNSVEVMGCVYVDGARVPRTMWGTHVIAPPRLMAARVPMECCAVAEESVNATSVYVGQRSKELSAMSEINRGIRPIQKVD